MESLASRNGTLITSVHYYLSLDVPSQVSIHLLTTWLVRLAVVWLSCIIEDKSGESSKPSTFRYRIYINIYIIGFHIPRQRPLSHTSLGNQATSCLELQKSAAACVKESQAGNGFQKNKRWWASWLFKTPCFVSWKTLARHMGEQCHHWLKSWHVWDVLESSPIISSETCFGRCNYQYLRTLSKSPCGVRTTGKILNWHGFLYYCHTRCIITFLTLG